MHSKRLLCVLAVLVSAPAHADWSGKGEAGLVLSSGNTEAETANLKIGLVHEGVNWKSQFGTSALYAADDVGATAQRWDASTQQDYNFGPRTFWFGAGRYEEDRFSGFEYQATVSTGFGRKFIDSASTKFTGTAGVGYKLFETRDAFDKDTGALIEEGAYQNESVARGTLDFEHDFNESTKLVDEFVVEAGADNTFVQNDLSLQVKMTQVLALAVGYSVRHNTKPPLGFEETDTLTTLNLVYQVE